MYHHPPRLSIVCPAYQEEEVLPHFHRGLSLALDPLENEYQIEIIYVDDGSRDGTLLVLRRLAEEDARVRYLSLTRNFGHQAALTAGLAEARGDLVVMMDSDLQNPPGLIPELLRKYREGFDIVLTIRAEDPTLGWVKRATSRAFYRIMGWLSETEIRPAAADFRLMTRRAVRALLEMRETHRFLRGMVQWLGFPTAEVTYQCAPRRAGVTKYTMRRMIGLAVDAVLSFSRWPLRVLILLGLVVASAGAVFALSLLVFDAGLGLGWAVVLAALNLVGGSILVGLGTVGEYVGRIYEEVKGRPIYLVKETSEDWSARRYIDFPQRPFLQPAGTSLQRQG